MNETRLKAQGKQARSAVQMLTKVKDIGFDDQLDPLQKEFLNEALRYYEQFTSRISRDPVVRLEHGLIYQQMGDIQRKLGKLAESDQAYRKAIEILEPLVPQAGPSQSVHSPGHAAFSATSWYAEVSIRAESTHSTGRRWKLSKHWRRRDGNL